MSTARMLIMFEEFEKPPGPGESELLEGEVIGMPCRSLEHQKIVRAIFFSLSGQVGDQVWPSCTGYLMAKSWLTPDVSVRWPEQRRSEKYFLGAPMIAVEVVSPGENADRKAAIYVDHDAAEVWVVDGRCRRMTIYARKGEAVIRRVERGEYRSEAAAVFISLPQIFGT